MNKEKQIEEMAKDLCDSTMCDLETFNNCRMPQGNCSRCQRVAKDLYNAGYRKQSEGCEFCGTTLYIKSVRHTMPLLAPITRADELRHELLNLTGEIYLPLEAKFCPVCGAKMKGGAE